VADLGPLFTDWVGELEDLSEKYTDAELRAITDFLTESALRQRNATRPSHRRRRARRQIPLPTGQPVSARRVRAHINGPRTAAREWTSRHLEPTAGILTEH
jgi:hypothetical protein